MRPSLLGTYEYAYGCLDAAQQRAYRGMLNSIRKREPIEAHDYPDVSTEDLAKVLLCIDMDHPEVYWMDEYQSVTARFKTAYSIAGTTYEPVFPGIADLDGDGRENIFERLMSLGADARVVAPWVLWSVGTRLSLRLHLGDAAARKAQESIDKCVEECRATIAPDADDYAILKAAVTYIVLNTRYNLRRARRSQDLRSVFANRESVCKGYAEALQYLLLSFGVPCFTTNGIARAEEGQAGFLHAWNYVQVDGRWCIVDPTFADTDWDNSDEASALPQWLRDTYVRYEYLCTDTSNRVAAGVVSYPKRTSASDFFRREGGQVDKLCMAQVAPGLFRLYSGESR